MTGRLARRWRLLRECWRWSPGAFTIGWAIGSVLEELREQGRAAGPVHPE